MGRKQTQTNTPGFATPPPTPQFNQLQSMVGKVDYAPPLRNQYARAKQDFNRSYKNPLGAYTTADVRDKTIRANEQEMNQDLGLDLSNAAMQNQQNAFGQQSALAELAQPRFYNAQTVSKQGFSPLDIIQPAASFGASLSQS